MGGNRYIGLHLVFELARQGHDVTIMNSHEAPMPEGARRIHADRFFTLLDGWCDTVVAANGYPGRVQWPS